MDLQPFEIAHHVGGKPLGVARCLKRRLAGRAGARHGYPALAAVTESRSAAKRKKIKRVHARRRRMTATVYRSDRPATCGFRLDSIDLAAGRYFSEVCGGFIAPRGPHKVAASPLQAGCKVGLSDPARSAS